MSAPHASAASGNIVQINAERLSYRLKRRDRAFLLAGLDLRDERLGKAGLRCQFLDRQPAIFAEDADRVFAVDDRINDLGRPGFLPGIDTRLNGTGFAGVDQILIIVLGQQDIALAFDGDALNFGHGVLLFVVDIAARTGLNDQNKHRLIIDDDAVLSDADAEEFTSLQLLKIDRLAFGESLDLGDDGGRALGLHLAEGLGGGFAVGNLFHVIFIAYSYMDGNKKYCYRLYFCALPITGGRA